MQPAVAEDAPDDGWAGERGMVGKSQRARGGSAALDQSSGCQRLFALLGQLGTGLLYHSGENFLVKSLLVSFGPFRADISPGGRGAFRPRGGAEKTQRPTLPRAARNGTSMKEENIVVVIIIGSPHGSRLHWMAFR